MQRVTSLAFQMKAAFFVSSWSQKIYPKISNATCRWHITATSSKTGDYLNKLPSQGVGYAAGQVIIFSSEDGLCRLFYLIMNSVGITATRLLSPKIGAIIFS